MIEVFGNLWQYVPLRGAFEARVITTNGTVKKNGYAVMGRGCAAEAARMFPTLPKLLGESLKNRGNKVFRFTRSFLGTDFDLVTFPVKHEWHEPADPDLIFESVCRLVDLTDDMNWSQVLLPRPGCGNGMLRWEDVRKMINPYLDERFYVITFEE